MNIKKIIEALWSLSLPAIKSGYPIYFNFTSNTLRTTFPKFQLSSEDVLQTINEAANSFYIVDGNKAYIVDNAFDPIWESISAAIIIACQQVLIVERMAETEDHSANAYFPWLRKAISKDLEDYHSSPFDYEDFEKVWIKLSKEVVILGGNLNLLNIEFGKKKGADQTKRFPLSQALLSKEDSLRMIEAIGAEEVRKKSQDSLLYIMLQEKKCLTARGRKLISLTWMQDKILSQIKSYALSNEKYNLYKHEVQESRIEASNLIIKAFNDEMNSSLLSSQVSLAVFDRATDNRITDVEISQKFIVDKIYEPGFVFLPFSNSNDCWILSNENISLNMSNKIMVCFHNDYEENVYAQIKYLFGGIDGVVKKKTIFKRTDLQYFLFKPLSIERTDTISNGKINTTKISFKDDKPIFENGITLDTSNSIFSSMHLPTTVIIKGIRWDLTGPVTINGHKTTFEIFKKDLKNIDYVDKFKVEFNDDIKFEIKVSGFLRSLRSIGYRTINEKVKPIGEWINSSNQTLYTLGEFSEIPSRDEPYKFFSYLVKIKKNHEYNKLQQLIGLSNRDQPLKDPET